MTKPTKLSDRARRALDTLAGRRNGTAFDALGDTRGAGAVIAGLVRRGFLEDDGSSPRGNLWRVTHQGFEALGIIQPADPPAPKPEPREPAPIQVGDRVRSFDFLDRKDLEGDRACFIEGRVVAITDPDTHPRFQDCARVQIQVERRVFGGRVCEPQDGEMVFAPVNGTAIWGGDTRTNQVERIEPAERTINLGTLRAQVSAAVATDQDADRAVEQVHREWRRFLRRVGTILRVEVDADQELG